MNKCPKCGSERIETDFEKGSKYERCMDCGRRVWIVDEKNTRETELRLRPWEVSGEYEEEGKTNSTNSLSKCLNFLGGKTNSNSAIRKPSFPFHEKTRCKQNRFLLFINNSFHFRFVSFRFVQWKQGLSNIAYSFGVGGVLFGAA